MFGLPDGQWDIMKGRIADLKIRQLAKQREKLEKEYRKEEVEMCIDNDDKIEDNKSIE